MLVQTLKTGHYYNSFQCMNHSMQVSSSILFNLKMLMTVSLLSVLTELPFLKLTLPIHLPESNLSRRN